MRKFVYISLFALVAASVHAQVVYTARPAYDLAHFGNYVVDFNNFTPGPTQYTDVTVGTPIGNVNFDAVPSSNNIEFLGNSNFSFLGANNLALYAFNGSILSDSLLITLPANSFSFGMDVISPSSTVPEPYKFTIFSGSTVLATITSPSVNNAYTFIGFDSLTSAITSIAVQITGPIGSGEPTIDNFTVVPEPGTWFAAALTLLFIGYTQRRKLVPALKSFRPAATPPR